MNSCRAVVAAAALIVIAGCAGISGTPISFDGERAYDLLKKQCSIGVRYPGSPGQKTTARLIQSELKGNAADVIVHKFTKNIRGKELPFENIYAVFNPDASRFVLLCTHWDTRPIADMEIDEAKKHKPILGANDGASGTAVLLELARVLHSSNPKVGVVLAFFDGEDYGPGEEDMYIGAREFAKTWKTDIRPNGKNIKFDYGILLDMIGDKDLRIPKEGFSVRKASDVVDKVWAVAKKTGHDDVFVDEEDYMINDDHVPLIYSGIKCIDIIDFNYGPWHTLDDTPDKCSAKSLKIVGDVVSAVIYSEDNAAK